MLWQSPTAHSNAASSSGSGSAPPFPAADGQPWPSAADGLWNDPHWLGFDFAEHRDREASASTAGYPEIPESEVKELRKFQKALREIESLEARQLAGEGLQTNQLKKIAKRAEYETEVRDLEESIRGRMREPAAVPPVPPPPVPDWFSPEEAPAPMGPPVETQPLPFEDPMARNRGRAPIGPPIGPPSGPQARAQAPIGQPIGPRPQVQAEVPPARAAAPQRPIGAPSAVGQESPAAPPRTKAKAPQQAAPTGPICRHFLAGRCIFGTACRNAHMNPGAPPPRRSQLEPAFDVDDPECGICFESIRSKKGERFGILENCDHAFCLSCIRSWRKQREQQDRQNLRLCPVCRKESFFVVPSDDVIADPDQKRRAIQAYKVEMARIPCKLFDYGRGTCPFGTSCFYLHLNPDGTRYVPPPLHWRKGADGSEVQADVKLSDFLAHSLLLP